MNKTRITHCPECGAPASPELNCQTAFNHCLALEFTDAGYGVVHHLTVATYMLQHSSRLSRQGWLEMRSLLHKFLVENRPPEEVRRTSRRYVDGSSRMWKITSRQPRALFAPPRWAKTILDVRTGSAQEYCADVSAWAAAALADASRVEPE